MKRIPMSPQGRTEAAIRQRKRVRAIKAGVVALLVATSAVWGYILLVE